MNLGSTHRGWLTFFLISLVGLSALTGVVSLSGRAPALTDDTAAPSSVGTEVLAADDNLASWNPNVECAALRTTIPFILGSAYPAQSAIGAPYHTNGTSSEGTPIGGVPHKRALSPPCTITNVTGQVLSTLVEIDGVYLSTWGVRTIECSAKYKNVNGGAPYPNNQTICDSHGEFFALGTTSGFLDMDIDQDWMARGYCGPGVEPCDNVSIAQYVSNGAVSLDIQGFVYFDGENWEIHPATGVRLSSGVALTAEPASIQTTRNYSAAASVHVYGTSANPVSLSVSGCPSDVVCSFSPGSGPARFTSTFRVNTSPASPSGTFDLSIRATNASLTTTVPFHLTIADRAVLAFRRGDGGAFSATQDTYIWSGAPDANNGSETSLRVDGVGCIASVGVCKSLIKFPSIIGPDAGQIPAGSRIVNASLDLTITNDGVTENAHQITEAWNEATATWDGFTTPGSPGYQGQVTFSPNHLGRFDVNITLFAQHWANGDANEGVLLESTHGNGVTYNASDSVRERPSLKVAFVPPSQPLVLAYDMESVTTDGKLKDLSGNANHGTLSGTTDIAGKVGRARHFNLGDRITAPAIPVPAADFTVAGWFRWTTNPSPYYSGIHGGGDSWELRVMADGRFGATFYQSTGPDVFTEIASPLAYNDGDWHHAAAVLRSGLVRIYVDGVLVAQDTTNPIASVRTSTQTIVGRVASDFIGDIDEVFIFSRALADVEVAAFAPPPPGSGPALRYDMETLLLDGRMKDLSGHVIHGTITGTTDVVGKTGQAKHFNAGDRITAPSISVPATDFTVAAWFNWTTNPSPYYSGVHGGGDSWELRVMADGRFGATFYQSTTVWTEIVSPLAYNDGEWHHAAAVLVSGLVRLYVDGILVAQDTTNPITSVSGSTQTVVGQVASDFVGDIDEVLVYTRSLSDPEIAALAPPPPADGPVLQYDMETLTGTGLMKDLSGHANHGTLSGTTAVPGKVGQATHFDGSGERITAPAIQVPAMDFTVAAWFRWTTNPSPYYSGIHGGGGSWELRVMANGGFGATFYQSSTVWTEIWTPLAYNDGTWHHVAAVVRSGLAELYVDGLLVAADTTNPITSVRTPTETVVGQLASNFIGDIDEVSVYQRALTSQELANMAVLSSGAPKFPNVMASSTPNDLTGNYRRLNLSQVSCWMVRPSEPHQINHAIPSTTRNEVPKSNNMYYDVKLPINGGKVAISQKEELQFPEACSLNSKRVPLSPVLPVSQGCIKPIPRSPIEVHRLVDSKGSVEPRP